MDGIIYFSNEPILGRHGFYDKKTDTAFVDGSWYDFNETACTIFHELGHKLHLSTGIFQKVKVFWKYLDPDVRKQVNAYGQQNPAEMMAELFRLFIMGELSEDLGKWIAAYSR